MNLKNLSEIEKETYEFIKDAGEIQTRNLPDRSMSGVISSLKNKASGSLQKIHQPFSTKEKEAREDKSQKFF